MDSAMEKLRVEKSFLVHSSEEMNRGFAVQQIARHRDLSA
jgi:hypothetical protein